MTDLTYYNKGMFSYFVAENEDGQNLWNEMAAQNNGNTYIYTIHLKPVLAQIRKAGYKVTKAKPVTKKEMNNMFAEFDELFA